MNLAVDFVHLRKGSAQYVIAHAKWRRSRGKRPSLPFRDISNPIAALAAAEAIVEREIWAETTERETQQKKLQRQIDEVCRERDALSQKSIVKRWRRRKTDVILLPTSDRTVQCMIDWWRSGFSLMMGVAHIQDHQGKGFAPFIVEAGARLAYRTIIYGEDEVAYGQALAEGNRLFEARLQLRKDQKQKRDSPELQNWRRRNPFHPWNQTEFLG